MTPHKTRSLKSKALSLLRLALIDFACSLSFLYKNLSHIRFCMQTHTHFSRPLPLHHPPLPLFIGPELCVLRLQGMGFPEIAVTGALPPFQNMLQAGVIEEPVFSFWLNRDVGGQLGGELTLGGVDPDHFKGEHVW